MPIVFDKYVSRNIAQSYFIDSLPAVEFDYKLLTFHSFNYIKWNIAGEYFSAYFSIFAVKKLPFLTAATSGMGTSITGYEINRTECPYFSTDRKSWDSKQFGLTWT